MTDPSISLVFDPDTGIGHYPVSDVGRYDAAYFLRYVGYTATRIGTDLICHRLAIVDKFLPREATILDVGIGCGQFVAARGFSTRGFDVSPIAVDLLRQSGRFADLRECPPSHDGYTFWDSLEHLRDAPSVINLLGASTRSVMVFVSIPIFKDKPHILRSRHFRSDEHYWYFTEAGLSRMFESSGFHLVHVDDVETWLGREDIKTYVFKK